MMIIGVDYHPSFQTIAFFMEETGECDERELNHRHFRGVKCWAKVLQFAFGCQGTLVFSSEDLSKRVNSR
jgi:hypothetical protein